MKTVMKLVALALVIAVALVAFAGPALGGGGNVLAPTEEPKEWSLTEAAAATAHFNLGGRAQSTLPAGFPFQILYIKPAGEDPTFNVAPGTMFYVPIVYVDNGPPILGAFPNVTDQAAVADYYFNPAQLGAEYIEIVVDGQVTRLTPDYMAGAVTPGLPTGGDRYTVAGVFLAPLTPGAHSVTIRVRFTGAALAPYGGVFEGSTTYTVIV